MCEREKSDFSTKYHFDNFNQSDVDEIYATLFDVIGKNAAERLIRNRIGKKKKTTWETLREHI